MLKTNGGGAFAQAGPPGSVAVMIWIRNQFGGHDDVVTAEQVTAWREQHAGRTVAFTHAEIARLVDAAL
jgi:hypothetical protein